MSSKLTLQRQNIKGKLAQKNRVLLSIKSMTSKYEHRLLSAISIITIEIWGENLENSLSCCQYFQNIA